MLPAMKYSTLFGKATRNVPKDEVTANAELLTRAGFAAPEPAARDDATLATVVWCGRRPGVRCVRVHEPAGAARAIQLVGTAA